MDWSQKALLKLVFDKYFAGPPTVEQYKAMFEKFISENSVRAQKNKTPLTYMEIMSLWNTFITPNPMSSLAMEQVMDSRIKQFLGKRPQAPGNNLSSPNKKAQAGGLRTTARTGTPTKPSHSAPTSRPREAACLGASS